jgi:hypothetical protein
MPVCPTAHQVSQPTLPPTPEGRGRLLCPNRPFPGPACQYPLSGRLPVNFLPPRGEPTPAYPRIPNASQPHSSNPAAYQKLPSAPPPHTVVLANHIPATPTGIWISARPVRERKERKGGSQVPVRPHPASGISAGRHLRRGVSPLTDGGRGVLSPPSHWRATCQYPLSGRLPVTFFGSGRGALAAPPHAVSRRECDTSRGEPKLSTTSLLRVTHTAQSPQRGQGGGFHVCPSLGPRYPLSH